MFILAIYGQAEEIEIVNGAFFNELESPIFYFSLIPIVIKFVTPQWRDDDLSLKPKFLKRSFGKQHVEIDKSMLPFLSFLLIFSSLYPFGSSILHLIKRHSIRYWGSQILPRSWYDSIATGAICFFLESLLCFFTVFGSGFLASFIYIYTQLTKYWLRTIR